MDIINSDAWDNQKHPYHPFSGDAPEKSGRATDKSIQSPGQRSAVYQDLQAGFTKPLDPKTRDKSLEWDPLHQTETTLSAKLQYHIPYEILRGFYWNLNKVGIRG